MNLRRTLVSIVVLFLSIVITLFALSFHSRVRGFKRLSVEAKEDVTRQVSTINREEMVQIAKEAIGNYKYDEDGPIYVETQDDACFVFFPAKKKNSSSYRGPDFAIKVKIDIRTKKVINKIAGS